MNNFTIDALPAALIVFLLSMAVWHLIVRYTCGYAIDVLLEDLEAAKAEYSTLLVQFDRLEEENVELHVFKQGINPTREQLVSAAETHRGTGFDEMFERMGRTRKRDSDKYETSIDGNPILKSCENCAYKEDVSDGYEYGGPWYACTKEGKGYMSNLKHWPFKTPQKCFAIDSIFITDWAKIAEDLTND